MLYQEALHKFCFISCHDVVVVIEMGAYFHGVVIFYGFLLYGMHHRV